MALQNKLKAFVRFDGSGRVIPSSLILQKSKPKVGNWKEINATQCCNGSSTTTTTTTLDSRPRISLTACGSLLPYQEITLVNGTSICDGMVYITGDFSQLQGNPFYVNVGSTYRAFSSMGNQAYPSGPCATCGGTTTTTTTAAVFMFNVSLGFSAETACAGVPAWNLYAATPFLNNGTTLYYNSSLNWAYDGAYGSYVDYQNVVYTLGGATIIDNGTSCSSITTTTTTTGIPLYPISGLYYAGNGGAICSNPIDVFSPIPNAYCTTPTLQNGSYVYNGNNVNAPVLGGVYISNTQGEVYSTSYDYPGQIISFPCS